MLKNSHIHLAQVWQTNMLEDTTGWPDFILELQVTLWTKKTLTKVPQQQRSHSVHLCFVSWNFVHIGTLAHYSRSMVHNKNRNPRRATCDRASSHDRIHATGIFTYMNGWFWWNMWVNIPYMDPMGIFSQVFWANQWKKQRRQTTIFNGRNPAGEPIDGCGYSANMFFHVCSLKSFHLYPMSHQIAYLSIPKWLWTCVSCISPMFLQKLFSSQLFSKRNNTPDLQSSGSFIKALL